MLWWTTKHHITWSKFQMHGRNCSWMTNHENLGEARPLWLQLKHAVHLFHQQVFLYSVIDKVCSTSTALRVLKFVHEIVATYGLYKCSAKREYKSDWERKTKGHSLQPFIFIVIFLSLAGDSASFNFQVSMWLNECSINNFVKSQREVFLHCPATSSNTECLWFLTSMMPVSSGYSEEKVFTFSQDPEES